MKITNGVVRVELDAKEIKQAVTEFIMKYHPSVGVPKGFSCHFHDNLKNLPVSKLAAQINIFTEEPTDAELGQ